MKTRYFYFKLVVILLYLASVGATVLWVTEGLQAKVENDLGAEISTVPGALEGRSVVLVVNKSELDWHDVQFVLNEQFAHSLAELPRGQQYTIALNQFSYTYAIPRTWNRGVWSALTDAEQPSSEGRNDLLPHKLQIFATEGKAEATLSP